MFKMKEHLPLGHPSLMTMIMSIEMIIYLKSIDYDL